MLPIASGCGAIGAAAIEEDCSGLLMVSFTGACDGLVTTAETRRNDVDFVGSVEPPLLLRVSRLLPVTSCAAGIRTEVVEISFSFSVVGLSVVDAGSMMLVSEEPWEDVGTRVVLSIALVCASANESRTFSVSSIWVAFDIPAG